MADQPSEDRLTTLLRDAAARDLGDTTLDHPGTSSDQSPEPSGGGRIGVRLLALAASVVLVAGALAFLITRDEAVEVQTPADGSQADSVPAMTVDPDDSAAVVANAIEATLSTSWVAILHGLVPDSGQAGVVYHPPAPQEGHPYATVGMGRDNRDLEVIGLSQTPQIVARCEADQDAPCAPGLWIDQTDSLARSSDLDVEETRAAFEAELIGLRGVEVDNPTAPPLQPGVYAVRADGPACYDDCRGTIEVRDGLVVHLELASVGESLVWDYGSFGEALPIEEPEPADIVEREPPATTVCTMTITVAPGADKAALEADVDRWLEDNGRRISPALTVHMANLPEVADVMYSNERSCEADPVRIEFRYG